MNPSIPPIVGRRRNYWFEKHPASLSWLAFGVLLAAWNAADDARSVACPQRPPALRRYSSVSVRAVVRISTASRILNRQHPAPHPF